MSKFILIKIFTSVLIIINVKSLYISIIDNRYIKLILTDIKSNLFNDRDRVWHIFIKERKKINYVKWRN